MIQSSCCFLLPDELSEEDYFYIHQITSSFSLPLVKDDGKDQFLIWSDEAIKLVNFNKNITIFVDFLAPRLRYRVTHHSKELLIKACDLKKNKIIWDATAGMGQDSFVLASFGATVYLFERHPIPAILLKDGIKRGINTEISSIVSKMIFYFGSITDDFIRNKIQELPDVIYLDPMFPDKRKSAGVKKEMEIFHEIIHEVNDEADFLKCARDIAKNRVVVKRPRLAEPLANIKPHFQYIGKSTRFDVYLPYSMV